MQATRAAGVPPLRGTRGLRETVLAANLRVLYYALVVYAPPLSAERVPASACAITKEIIDGELR